MAATAELKRSRHHLRLSTIVAATVAAAAYSSHALAQTTPPPSGTCALAAAPGVTGQRLSSGGRARAYRLFVPSSYDGRARLPLVLDSANPPVVLSRIQTAATSAAQIIVPARMA